MSDEHYWVHSCLHFFLPEVKTTVGLFPLLLSIIIIFQQDIGVPIISPLVGELMLVRLYHSSNQPPARMKQEHQ